MVQCAVWYSALYLSSYQNYKCYIQLHVTSYQLVHYDYTVDYIRRICQIHKRQSNTSLITLTDKLGSPRNTDAVACAASNQCFVRL